VKKRERAGKRERSRKAIQLDSFVPYRMSLLVHRMTLANSELYAKHHRLTVQEWRVLSIIADSGPLVPAEIRRLGTQDKSTISWAIKRMQKRNLLTRKPRASDGRTFEVALSDEGWKYYRHLKPIAERKAQGVLRRLTSSEATELHRLIDKLDGPGRPTRKESAESINQGRNI
jgi:DNA-binding MarR family transcriptional regulator